MVGHLNYASAELKADKDVVLEAVQEDGSALQYACAELKADKDVVLEACRQNGLALEYASAEGVASHQRYRFGSLSTKWLGTSVCLCGAMIRQGSFLRERKIKCFLMCVHTDPL
jgi:hypothetical protein